MNSSFALYTYKPYAYMKHNNVENDGEEQQRIFQELQAKIAALETELKRQKEALQKDSSILKFTWGDQFDTDSLH